MAKFEGQGETPRGDQEQHRKLDQLLASDYADVVHSVDSVRLATALGRPLIAKHLVEIARLEGASVVAHGCGTEKGNDAVRIDLAVRALNPALEVLAPLAVWDVTKQEKVAFARKRGIPLPATADSALVAQHVSSAVAPGAHPERLRAEVYGSRRLPFQSPKRVFLAWYLYYHGSGFSQFSVVHNRARGGTSAQPHG